MAITSKLGINSRETVNWVDCISPCLESGTRGCEGRVNPGATAGQTVNFIIAKPQGKAADEKEYYQTTTSATRLYILTIGHDGVV